MIGYAEGEKMSREESEFPITRSSTSPSLKTPAIPGHSSGVLPCECLIDHMLKTSRYRLHTCGPKLFQIPISRISCRRLLR